MVRRWLCEGVVFFSRVIRSSKRRVPVAPQNGPRSHKTFLRCCILTCETPPGIKEVRFLSQFTTQVSFLASPNLVLSNSFILLYIDFFLTFKFFITVINNFILAMFRMNVFLETVKLKR